MKAIHLLGLVTVAAWAFLIDMGLGTLNNITAQHAEGYPSAAQVFFNIWIPTVFAVVVVAAWVLARKERLRPIAVIVIALSLVAIFPYLLVSGGGI